MSFSNNSIVYNLYAEKSLQSTSIRGVNMKSDSEKQAGAVILRDYGQFFKKQYLDYNGFKEEETLENKSFLPIKLYIEPNERISIIDLVISDNTLMTKVLTTFSSLCVTINKLKKEAFERHIPYLSVYSDHKSNICFQIDTICSLCAFISRCDDVLRNICSQVFALYTESVVNISNIQLHYIINHIGEILTIIIIMELMISNISMPRDWERYVSQVKSMCQTLDQTNISSERYKAIKYALDNITNKIMSDGIVQYSLNHLQSLQKYLVDKRCNVINNEFQQYCRLAIASLDKLVQENPTHTNLYKCIKINALFVLYSNIFGANDKKTFKSLIDLNAKAHSVHIAGTTVWYPEQFLQRYLPTLCSYHGKIPQVMFKARHAFVTNKKALLNRDVTNLQSDCMQWIVAIEEQCSSKQSHLNAGEINHHAKTLLLGLDIASQASYSIITLTNLHLTLGMPLTKSMLMSIFESVQVLKSIKSTLDRNSTNILISINMIIQHLMFQAISSIGEVKKDLMSDKHYANQRSDELTCMVIAEKALKGAASTERILVSNVALSFIPEAIYLEENYTRFAILLEKVQTLTNYFESMKTACDCSWLYWYRNVLPIYFEQNFALQLNSAKLKYFMLVLDDCLIHLHSTDKYFKDAICQEFFEDFRSVVDEHVLKDISQHVETNLRLHIHSHLQLDVINPFTTDMLKHVLFNIDKLRLMNTYFAVVPYTEHYLSTMYYNLTTVVLSDWKTYGEMRQMAKFKFNLNIVQDNLPTQTLEQGLDVLEIMRNIHEFVGKYLYNLNNQIFIEKTTNHRHLNSINIRHVANSIRTHGTGIMNTTVNFTYQFLKKKFQTFSQFLYDEQIKSRLIKNLRHFRENKHGHSSVYSYKSADKFNKGIKNLGILDEGQSYLDLFRDLISQIGNAMGYVRMIRAGGRHCCAEATVFLPSLDHVDSFKQLCEEDNLSAETLTGAEILDQNIEDLILNFMQGTEYFKLLVDVFSPIFRNPQNVHLKNFFVIVPPLTINFVEHMILSKDKMTKKNNGAAFTDDGFAMGVAYILKLLDQDSDFESLQWFDSVWNHIKSERATIEEQKMKGTSQLQQALALTEKKLNTLEQEFQLIYFSLTSARIFFR